MSAHTRSPTACCCAPTSIASTTPATSPSRRTTASASATTSPTTSTTVASTSASPAAPSPCRAPSPTSPTPSCSTGMRRRYSEGSPSAIAVNVHRGCSSAYPQSQLMCLRLVRENGRGVGRCGSGMIHSTYTFDYTLLGDCLLYTSDAADEEDS